MQVGTGKSSAGKLSGGGIMNRKRTGAFVVLAAIGLMLRCSPAAASPVDGTWAIRDLVLDIFDCQGAVCGRVAWTKSPQQRRQDCGRTIVWGLSQAGPESWAGGSIYDPTDGNTYRLSAALETDGTLHARIYQGIPLFGKTEVLTRVPPRSRDGWCT
jgi:uncharacterized protein (DUF2147 family)